MAAWYQGLNQRGYAAIIDEFELYLRRRHHADTYRSCAYPMAWRMVTRGSQGNVLRLARYYVFSVVLFGCGHLSARMNAADASRWVEVEIESYRHDAFMLTNTQAREPGARCIRRFLNRWSGFDLNVEAFKVRILKSGGWMHTADTLGTLLAAYWTLVRVLRSPSERPTTTLNRLAACNGLKIARSMTKKATWSSL